jgi:hypothetical protein
MALEPAAHQPKKNAALLLSTPELTAVMKGCPDGRWPKSFLPSPVQ